MKYVLGCLLAGLLFASVAMASAEGAVELYAKSCKGCHGADGAKVAMGMTRPPKGLPVDEVKAALVGYKAGTYGGEKKAMMERVAATLADEEIDGLATYIAGF